MILARYINPIAEDLAQTSMYFHLGDDISTDLG